MNKPIIDAHIHLDMYEDKDCMRIVKELEKYGIESLISVSQHLASAHKNLTLAQLDGRIKPAFGFHPEQAIPKDSEITDLQHFIDKHFNEMIAVGEVGLPYYLRQEQKNIPLEPYLEILQLFIQQAVAFDKPIILHAVYDDAPLVCELLEKYSYKKAHFHWFKGDQKTTERMMSNGYFISITPDILYEVEIQQLAKQYPLSQLMVETDGPWPFEGPFKEQMTHPKMIHESIRKIAELKRMDVEEVYLVLYENTKRFYSI